MAGLGWLATETGRARGGGRADEDTGHPDGCDRAQPARLQHVTSGTLTSRASYTGFDDFWQPFTLAVGPAGHYLRALPADQQSAIRDACRPHLPDGPFTLPARAWYARGLVRSLTYARRRCWSQGRRGRLRPWPGQVRPTMSRSAHHPVTQDDAER